MKICVDRDLCEANAHCMGTAPEVFRVEDDDTLTLLMAEIPDDLLPAVRGGGPPVSAPGAAPRVVACPTAG